jgi:hypothetical protein
MTIRSQTVFGHTAEGLRVSDGPPIGGDTLLDLLVQLHADQIMLAHEIAKLKREVAALNNSTGGVKSPRPHRE